MGLHLMIDFAFHKQYNRLPDERQFAVADIANTRLRRYTGTLKFA
jgi:hypothetical protein